MSIFAKRIWLHARRGIAVALVFLASVFLWASGPASAQTGNTFEGRLIIIWGDPQPGRFGGGVIFELHQDDGTSLPLEVAPDQRNAAIGAFGKRVTVRGRAVTGERGRRGVEAESIEVIERENRSTVQPGAVTQRRMLSILVRYAGDTQTPHAPNFFKALANPRKPNPGLGIPATINGFFHKTSWGQLVWLGDLAGVGGLKATDWLTLPKTKTQYANCGWNSACASGNLSTLFADAMNLAVGAGVDVSVYDNINIMLNNDLDCCAWGGGGVYNMKFYGVTWNPPWAQVPGTFVHELGHSLGLPHSGWVYFAYDSNWDQMSRGTVASSLQCGSYNSANNGGASSNLFCDEPGSGYIAGHKDHLGWIPNANKVTINSISSTRVAIEANAKALRGVKLVKICLNGFPCTGNTARYYTVEARIKTGEFENSLPHEGVLIHEFQHNRSPIGGGNPCFFNTQSGWAVPVDSTPGDYVGAPTCGDGGAAYPNWGLHNAQFNVGQVFKNNSLGVRVKVLSRKGDKFVVRVDRTK